ncbi:MAG: diguanylate cyclase [Lachnospiraceae bacterium]
MDQYEERVKSLFESHRDHLMQTIQDNLAQNEFDSAMRLSEDLIQFCTENDNKEGLSLGYYCTGIVAYLKNDYISALDIFKSVLPMLERTRDFRRYATALNLMGQIYSAIGDDNRFMDCYVEGIAYAQEHNLLDVESEFFNSIGSRYQVMGAHEIAITYFQKALEILELSQENEEEKNREKILVLLNYALSSACEHKQERALYLINSARELYTPVYKEHRLALSLTEARIDLMIGRRKEAQLQADHILSIIKQRDITWDFEQYLGESMNFFLNLGELKKADEALQVFEEAAASQENAYWKMCAIEYRIKLSQCQKKKEEKESLYEKFFRCYEERRAEEMQRKIENMKLRVALSDAENEQSKIMSKNRLLESRSEIDSLTGIHNRYSLEKDSRECYQHIRGKRISLGIIDIDYFKQLNDTYGHAKGDRCLVEVAQILLMAVGEAGKVYRYGGDEFIVVIEEKNALELEKIAENVKYMIEETGIENKNSAISDYVTLSQGYALCVATDHITRPLLFKKADKELYHIKTNGKNGYSVCELKEG